MTTAEDGEEGVQTALAGGFDLVLMEIQMPRLDGVSATRRICGSQTATAHVPIIGQTANVLSRQREEYLAAGMDAVVGKPVSPASLLQEILRIAQATRRASLRSPRKCDPQLGGGLLLRFLTVRGELGYLASR